MALLHRFRRPTSDQPATVTATATAVTTPPCRPPGQLPPSVARVAARTRLSAEILAAVLEIEKRSRATLDDIERADALAERLIARRRERQHPHTTARTSPIEDRAGTPGTGCRARRYGSPPDLPPSLAPPSAPSASA